MSERRNDLKSRNTEGRKEGSKEIKNDVMNDHERRNERENEPTKERKKTSGRAQDAPCVGSGGAWSSARWLAGGKRPLSLGLRVFCAETDASPMLLRRADEA